MHERLLIIGASGFIGARWARHAQDHFHVFCAARRAAEGPDWLEVDVTDPASVRRAFDIARPDLVTHLAALSDIDRCEREPELAEQINYFGAMHVASECADRKVRLLYSSTDAVFDGTKHIYYENDPPTPLNWYGKTKARAEQGIARLLPLAVIARFSLVLGRGAPVAGNSYLEKVLRSLAAGNPVVTPTFEFRNPIDVCTLCSLLLELSMSREATGIIHIGASDKMSRYDLAVAITERMGYDTALIVPQSEPVPGRAPRGRDDFLVTDRLRQFCRTPIPTCREVIERACHAVA